MSGVCVLCMKHLRVTCRRVLFCRCYRFAGWVSSKWGGRKRNKRPIAMPEPESKSSLLPPCSSPLTQKNSFLSNPVLKSSL